MKPANVKLITGLAILVIGGVSFYYWQSRQVKLPDYIASGNGRIEAEEVHVATKAGGRVERVLIQEGDIVHTGQLLATIDTAELKATYSRTEADLASARQSVAEAKALVYQKRSDLKLAKKELDNAKALFASGSISRQELDKYDAECSSAIASLEASLAKLTSTQHHVAAATAEVARIKSLLEEDEIKAPISGRVQFRLAEPGEVLGPGGRIATILDLTDVYMTIFLPTEQAGKIQSGAEARIVADAYPDAVIPASVKFVSAEAQFTPREVETRTEREKLMFRVKVQITEDYLKNHLDQIRSGLPGVSYVLLGAGHVWPVSLAVKRSNNGVPTKVGP